MAGMTDLAPAVHPDVEETSQLLTESIRAILAAIPDGPHSPTTLSRKLELSRVTMSKLMGAVEQSTPFDVLERIPGPDSLRDFVAAAARLGADPALIETGGRAIERFDLLIRSRFGTRAALHAAIGGQSSSLRARVDQSARSDVFSGLRQILGLEANTWLTSMFFVPSAVDPEFIAVTTIQGALGMRRLRPDTPVYFTFGSPFRDQSAEPGPSQSPISLQEFYTNEPAKLDVAVSGGQVRHQLADDRIGKDALTDMLAVSHTDRGSRRYAVGESVRRGVSLFVDTPVRMLICDAILHRDVFPGSEPELLVYNPGSRGPANPNDRARDIDRVAVTESVSFIPDSVERFSVPEVPNYAKMIQRICGQIGRSPDEFRVYRLRMAYPVPCFQIGVAFRAPEPPTH
jgi:hypothetical protein